MADFVQQGITNLALDLRFVRADGLNILLVQENVVGRIGREDTLVGPRDPGKQSQQQAAPIRFLRWRVFHNNCQIRQPASKRPGEVVEDLANQLLETHTVH